MIKLFIYLSWFISMLIMFPFTPEIKTQETQTISDDYHPVWSPDSRKIVFDTNRQGGGIFIFDLGSNTIERVTDKGSIYTNWSPDGKHLAFSSGNRENLEIYSIDIDGHNLHLLVSDSFNNIRPVWSPDSKSITFQSSRDQSSIFVMNADGTHIRKVIDEATIGATLLTPYDGDANIWSADSSEILFTTGKDDQRSVYIVNVNGNNLRRLVGPDIVSGATWSADSKLIAVTLKREQQFSIYIIDPDGKNLSLLVSDAYDPIWSHEANWLAYFGKDADHNKSAISRLQILKVRDTFRRIHSISVDEFSSVGDLSWSPDRRYFAFASCVGDADIFIVDTEDGTIKNITDESLNTVQPTISICDGVG